MKKYLLLFLCVIAARYVFADEIILKTGKSVTGEIISNTEESLKVDLGEGVSVTYEKDEIERVLKSDEMLESDEMDDSGEMVEPDEILESDEVKMPIITDQELPEDIIVEKELKAFEDWQDQVKEGKENVSQDQSAVAEIFDKVLLTYQSLTNLTASGTVRSKALAGSSDANLVKSFSIKLARPDLFSISWKTKKDGIVLATAKIWNTSKGAFQFIDTSEATLYWEENKDKILQEASGISSGITHLVPSLFFDSKESILRNLTNPAILKEEQVNGEDCFVITGITSSFEETQLWVSKESYLILKQEDSVQVSSRNVSFALEGFLEEKFLAEGLKAMGLEVTDENQQILKSSFFVVQHRVKNLGSSGYIETVYDKIAVNEDLDESAFEYDLPASATKIESKLVLKGEQILAPREALAQEMIEENDDEIIAEKIEPVFEGEQNPDLMEQPMPMEREERQIIDSTDDGDEKDLLQIEESDLVPVVEEMKQVPGVELPLELKEENMFD